MDQINTLGTLATSGTLREFVNQSLRRSTDSDGLSAAATLDDRVEISELATFLNQLAELPEARARRIVAVRNQIEQGTYETAQKLDIATERLLSAL